jgi:hypothetical protein
MSIAQTRILSCMYYSGGLSTIDAFELEHGRWMGQLSFGANQIKIGQGSGSSDFDLGFIDVSWWRSVLVTEMVPGSHRPRAIRSFSMLIMHCIG